MAKFSELLDDLNTYLSDHPQSTLSFNISTLDTYMADFFKTLLNTLKTQNPNLPGNNPAIFFNDMCSRLVNLPRGPEFLNALQNPKKSAYYLAQCLLLFPRPRIFSPLSLFKEFTKGKIEYRYGEYLGHTHLFISKDIEQASKRGPIKPTIDRSFNLCLAGTITLSLLNANSEKEKEQIKNSAAVALLTESKRYTKTGQSVMGENGAQSFLIRGEDNSLRLDIDKIRTQMNLASYTGNNVLWTHLKNAVNQGEQSLVDWLLTNCSDSKEERKVLASFPVCETLFRNLVIAAQAIKADKFFPDLNLATSLHQQNQGASLAGVTTAPTDTTVRSGYRPAHLEPGQKYENFLAKCQVFWKGKSSSNQNNKPGINQSVSSI